MNEKIKYGLLEADINDIISILTKNQKINKIILFGGPKGLFTMVRMWILL
jgi:hypothetical protein